MLGSFYVSLDLSLLEKKLKHYFSDTAPAIVDVAIDLNTVIVTNKTKNKTINVILDSSESVSENIASVIQECENNLFPVIISETNIKVDLTKDKIYDMTMKGMSLDEIKNYSKKVYKKFVITRLNPFTNTLDYKDIQSGKINRAHLQYPLVLLKKRVYDLQDTVKDGIELYNFIFENSVIEELE